MLLVIFGITMIRSAVAGNIDVAGYDQRQLNFALFGFAVMFIVASIDYHYWSSVSKGMYIVAAVSLAVLNVVATAVFGSARWFNLLIVNVQPSEIAKIVVILVLADYFTRNQDRISDPRFVIRSFLWMMGITVWIILQPNLSTSIVMVVIWFALLWAGGLRIKHLLLFTLTGITAVAVSFPALVKFEIIKEYQLLRITNFLFPDQNATYGDNYNILQAIIAIGSGGLFGQGYGHGSQVQLRFLKVRWSDFIFSAMAQEFGFIGTVLVMLIVLFVVYRCLRAARLSRDTYGALICYGVAALIAFQAMVNIGVNLNLIPATGLTLPFVSYGGSSLVTNSVAIGLVQSVILRHRALEFE